MLKKVSDVLTYTLILISSISILPSLEDQSSNSGNGSQDPLGVSNLIAVIIITPLGGLVVYLLKRSFVNKDFEFQKKIEHENWLYEQFNPLASEYYVPLAKFADNAGNSIAKARILNDEESINIAYFHTCIFLSKYMDFKNSKGANFLFKTREFEDEAIIAVSFILFCLPFNELDITKIHEDVKNNVKMKKQFTSHEYETFKNWLTGGHCGSSIDLVVTKLDYLQNILDTGGEEIAHPEVFDNNDALKIIPQRPEDDIFYIFSSNVKYAKCGDVVAIFGKGFEHERVKDISFFLGNPKSNIIKLNIIKKTDDVARLQIPSNVPDGIYDVFAQFSVSRFGGIDTDVTIGVPITVHS